MGKPSPLLMPRRRINHMPERPVFSTSTGDVQAAMDRFEVHYETQFEVDAYDPYCFVCGRCTDHVAEHDGLVEAGLASYALDGSVHKTAAWDADRAREIAAAEYAAFEATLTTGVR